MRTLVTDRLHLSPFGAGDAPLLVALDADPEVVRYVHLGPFTPPPPGRYEAEVLPMFLKDRGPACGFWQVRPVFDNRPGPFAGWVSLRPVAEARWYAVAGDELNLDPRSVELGYRFARWSWGRGYATEACRAILDRAARRGAGGFCAIRQEDNAGSARVMRKLGFRPVRTFQLPGVPRPTVLELKQE